MSRISAFAFETVLWFFFWLAVWYFACNLLIVPVYGLVKLTIATLFPSWAGQLHWIGHDFILSTNIPLGKVDGSMRLLALKANFLTFGIGWPLIIALLLASDAQRIIVKILLATVILWVPQTIGIASEFLNAAYIQSGLLPISRVSRYALIVMFQFLIMEMPPLAPVIIWLVMEKNFVGSLVSDLRNR